MKHFRIALFMVISISAMKTVYSQTEDVRILLFNDLHNLYIQWNDGLFGSKHFYKMLINEKLYKSIKMDIKTPEDYLWMNMDEEFRCVFMFSDWLVIRTILTEEQYRTASGKNKGHRTWYRSDEIFGIEGTIHDYSLDESVDKEKVTLYLKNVKIIRGK